ncbi:MAG: arginine repressor, partial [Actinomycetota bacterium]
LAERNGPPTAFGKRMFTEVVRSVDASGNLVVVRTFPGMAPTIAAVLDQAEVKGILGTVAGDDTVLVVADERAGGRRVAKRIAELGSGA